MSNQIPANPRTNPPHRVSVQSRNITVLVKPASAACNLCCSYCFYLETAKNRQQGDRGIMEKDTAAALIATTLDFAAGGTVTYLFQGGEPLLAGLDFFQNFITLVQSHQKKQVERGLFTPSQACYMVQTNGTLLNQAFCQFFAKHDFILGISLDGPAHIHNLHRYYPSREKDCHSQVIKAISMIREHKIKFSVLAVVTKAWAGREREIYQWFQDQELDHLQFIYCIPPQLPRTQCGDSQNKEKKCPDMQTQETYEQDNLFSLTNDEYSQLNREFFNLYWNDLILGKDISIRFYDNLLAMVQGYQPEQCGMMGYCPATITVESDGSLYPCDFYCNDTWYIGNIRDMSLKELFYHPVMQEFLVSSQRQEEECKNCSVKNLCRGGCRRERDRDGTGSMGLHPYCQGRKEFLAYLLEKVQGHHPS